MDRDILNINQGVLFDDVIISKELHTYQAYSSTTLNYNDEHRIVINNLDLNTLPSDSFLSIEGKLETTDKDCKLVNNAFMFLFDEIRYLINGVEIDKVRNPGITTTLKGLVSFTHADARFYEGAGWSLDKQTATIQDKSFQVLYPMRAVLGSMEMYRKIIINAKQELVLLRSRNDDNVIQGKEGKIKIEKLQWKMPHINVSDENKLRLMRSLKSDKPIPIAFRAWELHEMNPMKSNVTSDIWQIRSSNSLERPRYIIIGFQTKRHYVKEADSSKFDPANLRNLKLYLNDKAFPYDRQEYDFSTGKYSMAYQSYASFQQSYYGRNESDPLINYTDFKKNAIFVIDCSRQSDQYIKSGIIDISLELDASGTGFPPETVAYCLVIHDVVVEYSPLTGFVNKLVR